VLRSKYSVEEVVFTKECVLQSRVDYMILRDFFTYLIDHTDFDPQDIMNTPDVIVMHVLGNLHKTNTKIQRAYEALDPASAFQLVMQSINELTSTYFPILQQQQKQHGSIKKALFLIFDTFLKLLAPIVPLLVEEAYQHVRIHFGCYSTTHLSVHSHLFPVTKEVMSKETKQMWESFEKVQSMVEKEKNRMKGVAVHVKIFLNIYTCRDGHNIHQLIKETPILESLTSSYFGVNACIWEFKTEGESKFCHNLKQAAAIIVTPISKLDTEADC